VLLALRRAGYTINPKTGLLSAEKHKEPQTELA